MNHGTRATLRSAFAAAITFAVASAASAGILKPDVFIYADENGFGTIDFLDSANRGGGLLNWGLVPDFGPGGFEEALFYDMGGPPELIIGDVIIYEPGTKVISDLIRFSFGPNDRGEFGWGFYFYSDLPDKGEIGDLADVGIPEEFNELTVSFEEMEIPLGGRGVGGTGFGLIYTPGPNDPGFVEGSVVQYTFISDIPAPGSAALLGLAGLLTIRRRR